MVDRGGSERVVKVDQNGHDLADYTRLDWLVVHSVKETIPSSETGERVKELNAARG